MVTTIVVITVMKIRCTAPREHVHQTVSVVRIIDAYRLPGIAMATTIVVMAQTNHQSTASRRVVHVSETYSRAIMVIVYRVYTFVTAITIVWIIRMKIRDINAVSVTVRLYCETEIATPPPISI